MKRMLCLLAPLLVATQASAEPTRFIDGFLAQCTAVGAGTCTENSGGGYARQPISFNVPVRGVSTNLIPYFFGAGGAGVVTGHAIYDAPTGGNLLEVIPLAVAATFGTTNGSIDQGDVAALSVTYTAMTGYFVGAAYSNAFAAGATLGTTPDGSTVTTGIGLNILRGIAYSKTINGSASPVP